jgi:hypothetical protein
MEIHYQGTGYDRSPPHAAIYFPPPCSLVPIAPE